MPAEKLENLLHLDFSLSFFPYVIAALTTAAAEFLCDQLSNAVYSLAAIVATVFTKVFERTGKRIASGWMSFEKRLADWLYDILTFGKLSETKEPTIGHELASAQSGPPQAPADDSSPFMRFLQQCWLCVIVYVLGATCGPHGQGQVGVGG